MKDYKVTKKSLILSGITLMLSVILMLGTTYAWYTDSVSSGVNVITSGNLDVEITKGTSSEEQTVVGQNDKLKWTKVDSSGTNSTSGTTGSSGTGDSINWEPGKAYKLESFTIKNTGSLDIEYEFDIPALENKGIEIYFKRTSNGTSTSGNEFVYLYDGSQKLQTSASLAKGASDTIEIKAVVPDTGAQGGQIENIVINIRAKQDSSESDSFGNTYDEGAEYRAEQN